MTNRICPGQAERFVFTASTKEHATRCLARVLGDAALVGALFGGLVDTRSCGLATKHAPASFEAAMAAAGVPRDPATGVFTAAAVARCVLLDDSVRNIQRAKAMGWRTVLVGKVERDSGAALPTPPEADFHVATLHELPAVMPELFA